MTLIRDEDGAAGSKILACKVAQHWTLPGAIFKPGESEEDCQARGLRHCTGLATGERVKVYEGAHTIVFVASADKASRSTKGKLVTAWLTEAQFLSNTAPTANALFTKVFADVRSKAVAQSTVISKLRDGRILYAIQFDQLLPNLDGKDEWLPQEPHYVHAKNAADANEQFNQMIGPHDIVRVVATAPAIGFFEDEKGVLHG